MSTAMSAAFERAKPQQNAKRSGRKPGDDGGRQNDETRVLSAPVVATVPAALINQSLMQLAVALYPEFPRKDDLMAELRKQITSNPIMIDKAIEFVVRWLANCAAANIRNDMGAIENIKPLERNDGDKTHRTRYLDALQTAVTLFDVVLPFVGVTLGDATAGNLSTVADAYEGRATISTSRAKAYRHLQSMLARSNKATVREAFTIPDVKRILGNIESEA